MKASKNGIAFIVLALEAVLSALGVEFESGTVAKAVEGIVIAISLVMMAWHQFERSDTYLLVFKK